MTGRIDDSWTRQKQGIVGRTETEVHAGRRALEEVGAPPQTPGVYRFGRNGLLNV